MDEVWGLILQGIQAGPCGGRLQRIRAFRTGRRTQTQCSGSFQVTRSKRGNMGEEPLEMVLKVDCVHTGRCGKVRTVSQIEGTA